MRSCSHSCALRKVEQGNVAALGISMGLCSIPVAGKLTVPHWGHLACSRFPGDKPVTSPVGLWRGKLESTPQGAVKGKVQKSRPNGQCPLATWADTLQPRVVLGRSPQSSRVPRSHFLFVYFLLPSFHGNTVLSLPVGQGGRRTCCPVAFDVGVCKRWTTPRLSF